MKLSMRIDEMRARIQNKKFKTKRTQTQLKKEMLMKDTKQTRSFPED